MNLDHDPPAQFRTAIDQLHDVVAKQVGSDDFGSDDYLRGLKVLTQSMDYDPHFTEKGRRAGWGLLIEVLSGRAQAIKSMKENPGFDARPILSPVVITGVPRTGTTALHRLMGVDQRFQGLQTWLLDLPMPRPPMETWENYPQYRKTAASLEAQYAAAPAKRVAHFRAAEEVHECCMVMRQAFVSNLWSCSWSAPTYDAWWQDQSEWPAYQHYYRCVQLIGANDADKRWLLKNPGHIETLDLLFAIYPDARVIQTHRDPAYAVPSLVDLLIQMHPVLEEGRREQRAQIMMQREVAKWSSAVRKCEQVRQTHPGQVLDVRHADFHRDPMAVLEQIYAFIGMDITERARAGFAQRIEEKPELARGQHRYNILDFGMTEDEAREPFRDYIERYDLMPSKGEALMKAAIYPGEGKPITIENLPDPEPGADDVVLKVHRCGVCGTDLSMTKGGVWDFGRNVQFGHEYAGEIVAVGGNVSGYKIGERVAVLSSSACGQCEACLSHGNNVLCRVSPKTASVGFAEFAKVPANGLTRLPSTLSMVDGALIEPLAIALYGVKLAAIQPGDRVLVLGGGTVALYAMYWARRLGAGRIVAMSRSARRKALSLDMGADAFVPFGENEIGEVQEALGGAPQIVLECVGAEGMLTKAIMHAAQFGKILSLGFCTSPDPIIPGMASHKCVSMQFAVGYSMKEFLYIASQMDKGHCDPKAIVTNEVPLVDLPGTMSMLRAPNAETKVHVLCGAS